MEAFAGLGAVKLCRGRQIIPNVECAMCGTCSNIMDIWMMLVFTHKIHGCQVDRKAGKVAIVRETTV